ncbi:MAG: hypothetical protein MUC36_28440, partial [Planctomycetes bacterium]|nr:hypothetical protein [Planctomycetota bacterium]
MNLRSLLPFVATLLPARVAAVPRRGRWGVARRLERCHRHAARDLRQRAAARRLGRELADR